jgi:hypothetical protein
MKITNTIFVGMVSLILLAVILNNAEVIKWFFDNTTRGYNALSGKKGT